MKVEYSTAVTEALENAPDAVKKAFFKQVKLLEQNLRHPSLRAKKYDETTDRWQARVKPELAFLLQDRRRHLPHPQAYSPPKK
ncbi:MAG: hypothetical protein IT165_33245 [Bryobacterales bacterium]|nr:hypothetical protein [Bryobacterales bacterium]